MKKIWCSTPEHRSVTPKKEPMYLDGMGVDGDHPKLAEMSSSREASEKQGKPLSHAESGFAPHLKNL